jgi:hypothetical protein
LADDEHRESTERDDLSRTTTGDDKQPAKAKSAEDLSTPTFTHEEFTGERERRPSNTGDHGGRRLNTGQSHSSSVRPFPEFVDESAEIHESPPRHWLPQDGWRRSPASSLGGRKGE